MALALHIGTILVTLLLGISLLTLLMGLGMAARPESFADLGLHDTPKTGMVLALLAGIGALASAVLGRVLDLLRSALAESGDLPLKGPGEREQP